MLQPEVPDRPSLMAVLLGDVERQLRVAGSTGHATTQTLIRQVVNHRFHPVFLLRVSLWAARHRSPFVRPFAKVASYLNMTVYGVEAALQSDIGPGLYFPHAGGIVLGAARIGANATIFQGVTLGATTLDLGFVPDRRPRVGDDVTISAGAKVLGGISIGAGAVIGANAVVIDNVADGDVVGGVPARVLRAATSDHGHTAARQPEQQLSPGGAK